jgi:DNA-binding NarL/FixJ family response regulator
MQGDAVAKEAGFVKDKKGAIMATRLVITDDHQLIREGLTQFLGMSPDIEVVAEAATGDELLEKLRTTTPDLLLLDLTMPGRSGVRSAILKALSRSDSRCSAQRIAW